MNGDWIEKYGFKIKHFFNGQVFYSRRVEGLSIFLTYRDFSYESNHGKWICFTRRRGKKIEACGGNSFEAFSSLIGKLEKALDKEAEKIQKTTNNLRKQISSSLS